MELTLLAVIPLILSATLSQVKGDQTQLDHFLLSKLDILSREHREMRNRDVMIEYYGSMDLDKLTNIVFNPPQLRLYIIHQQQNVDDLGCHSISDYDTKKREPFNNYVLLPRYPTPDEINALDVLSQACTQQLPRQYDKYIAGYLGPPPHHEQTITRRKLVVMPVPPCTNHPNNIDRQTLTRIKVFINKFQHPFEMNAQGRKQYAVVYYGGTDLTDLNPPNPLFDIDRRIVEGDGWVAALPEPRGRHSEDLVLSRVDCRNIRNKDVYLYTHFSPCRDCAEVIVKFAQQCSTNYRSFKVFYRAEYRDCLQSATYIKGYSSDRQLKMDFFQVYLGPRPQLAL